MRLTAIRLAGFKSFVDRTQLQLSSNLTAVVGPNGCGKSNLIDAVRWVLGESSARQLRGTSLEDVIFNGSRTRKPVGRASIELVFDNSEKSIGGQWGAYAEIAVRRELTRDGQSVFYINAQKCRRKDVTELFLGTGLGPRSNYAIIEQGTISRLVEAQPEDLRQMLEEAAGVSRYKEKRRETETRIRHTRENLERLGDLIVEIDERLAKLKRQVSAARRYKELRESQRQLRAAQFGLRWRETQTQRAAVETALAAAEAESKQANSQLAEAIAELREAEQQTAAAEVQRQSMDEAFYASQAEQNRLEQERRHREELRNLRQTEVVELEAEARQLEEKLEAARRRHLECDASLAHIDQRLQAVSAQEQEANSEQSASSTALSEAQNQLMAARRAAEEPRTQQAREQARLEQLQRQTQSLEARQRQREQELQQLRGQQPDTDLEQMRQAAQAALLAQDQSQADLDALAEKLQHSREALVEAEERSKAAATELTAAEARFRVLEAEQERSLRDDETQPPPPGVAVLGVVGERLQVPAGRERAAEAVLGDWLKAQVIQADALPAEVGINQRLVLDAVWEPGDLAANNLAQGVRAPATIRRLLAGFVFAESATRARELLASGAQACATAQGELIWAEALAGAAAEGENSVLLRQKALEAAQQQYQSARAAADACDQANQAARETMRGVEQAWSEAGRALGVARKTSAEEAQRLTQAESALERHNRRQQDLLEALEAMGDELRQLAGQREEVEASRATHAAALEKALAVAETAEQAWREIQSRSGTAQQQAQRLREELRRLRAEREELSAQRAAAQSAVASTTQGLEQTNQGIARARQSLADSQGGGDTEAQLATAQARHRENVEQRAQSQQKMQQCQQRRAEAQRRNEALRQRSDALLAGLQDKRLERERLASRHEALGEQMQEFGLQPQSAQQAIVEGQTVASVHAELEDIERKLARLGAVNLAAVEEFNEESARAEDLRAQDADLRSALEQLETAMAQIDRETRALFRKTYNAVNEGFSARFPRLFGGGEAGLELIGDDVLSAGVRVMARPPGKRNASIALLSGGEKALTAVALVFALFELNPAPFCMLDEVDAPLDDANVVRFCEVVREMSAQVQFIVVTHNKVTMEMADTLHGVTMQEAGVSRLVGVDVSAAVAMTENTA